MSESLVLEINLISKTFKQTLQQNVNEEREFCMFMCMYIFIYVQHRIFIRIKEICVIARMFSENSYVVGYFSQTMKNSNLICMSYSYKCTECLPATLLNGYVFFYRLLCRHKICMDISYIRVL